MQFVACTVNGCFFDWRDEMFSPEQNLDFPLLISENGVILWGARSGLRRFLSGTGKIPRETFFVRGVDNRRVWK